MAMAVSNLQFWRRSNCDGRISAVLGMVCLYIFLVIERPWESVRYLQGVPIERIYGLLMIATAFLAGRVRISRSPTNKWICSLLLLHFLLAPFAFSPQAAVDQGIEYAKMVVLYLLMLAVVRDEATLEALVRAYVFAMVFYVLHSAWEYHNGRHLWRMGISRMMGADSTFDDPNAFAASVVLSLPFVYALLRFEKSSALRALYLGYFALAVVCVVLTGSRTASVAFLALTLIWALFQGGGWRKVVAVTAVAGLLTLIWVCMPSEKQDRVRTLWDDEAGPASARMSAEGRMIGWKVSLKMFKERPLTGVGAGGKNFMGYRVAYRADNGPPSPTQSHVLYGEVLAELGVFGGLFFGALVLSTLNCCRRARVRLMSANLTGSFSYSLGGAISCGIVLLLIFGIGGHNFYRPLWLWLAAWAGSLLHITSEKT